MNDDALKYAMNGADNSANITSVAMKYFRRATAIKSVSDFKSPPRYRLCSGKVSQNRNATLKFAAPKNVSNQNDPRQSVNVNKIPPTNGATIGAITPNACVIAKIFRMTCPRKQSLITAVETVMIAPEPTA